jgi:hypothetical protein
MAVVPDRPQEQTFGSCVKPLSSELYSLRR